MIYSISPKEVSMDFEAYLDDEHQIYDDELVEYFYNDYFSGKHYLTCWGGCWELDDEEYEESILFYNFHSLLYFLCEEIGI